MHIARKVTSINKILYKCHLEIVNNLGYYTFQKIKECIDKEIKLLKLKLTKTKNLKIYN